MLIKGELWRLPAPIGQPSIMGVTTNAIITSAGLVMGKGSAGEAVSRIPGIRQEVATALRAAHPQWHFDGRPGEDYGFLVIREPVPGQRVGFAIIQAKRHWRDASPLDLVLASIAAADQEARARPGTVIRCPVPGIGAGRLSGADRACVLDACADSRIHFIHR